MKILVTGGTGLLGRKVCEVLEAHGHHLTVVGRGFPKQKGVGVERVVADLSEKGFSSRFPRNVDVIIHLAQSAKYRDFPGGASDVFAVNLGSTQELLDYGVKSGVKRFLYASSGGVYQSAAFNFEEESRLRNPRDIDFYLASKLGGELLTQSYRAIFSHTILRFFFMYGPGQRRHMLLPRLYDQVALGEEILLEGQNGLIINPIHVEDAALAVANSLTLAGSHTVNVAGPDQISLGDIVGAFGKHLRVPPVLRRSGVEDPRLVADITKMTALFGKPRHRLFHSIEDVALAGD